MNRLTANLCIVLANVSCSSTHGVLDLTTWSDWPKISPAARPGNLADPLRPMRYLPPELYERISPADWIDEELHVFQEPSLWAPDDKEVEAYRCVMIPARYPRFVVRAVRLKGRARLIAKAALYSPATGRYTDSRFLPPGLLTAEQWQALADTVDQSGVWEAEPFPGSDGSLDGAMWVVEVRRGDRYRVVIRENLGAGDRVRAVCLRLFALSGMFGRRE